MHRVWDRICTFRTLPRDICAPYPPNISIGVILSTLVSNISVETAADGKEVLMHNTHYIVSYVPLYQHDIDIWLRSILAYICIFILKVANSFAMA